MSDTELIDKTADFVKAKFSGESSGHDWWHMYRVWQLSKTIAANELGANLLVVELAALLHDIADWKFHDGDQEAGPKAAREWLDSLHADPAVTEQVQATLRDIPFRGEKFDETVSVPLKSQIVYDADNLDAIGAIGIARAFAYAGAKGRPMHDPYQPHKRFDSFEDYKNSESPPAINHFHERLLLLKNRMFTNTGKKIAKHRHEYMEQFLTEFYAEWEGDL